MAADRRVFSLQLARQLQCCGCSEGHLSEVSGIGARRRERVMESGIRGLEELAAAEPDWLAAQMERFGDQHGVVARTLVAQARVQRDDRVERLLRSPAVPDLEAAPGVLLYDIESDPDARHDFLHASFACREIAGLAPACCEHHPVLMLQDHPEDRSRGG